MGAGTTGSVLSPHFLSSSADGTNLDSYIRLEPVAVGGQRREAQLSGEGEAGAVAEGETDGPGAGGRSPLAWA